MISNFAKFLNGTVIRMQLITEIRKLVCSKTVKELCLPYCGDFEINSLTTAVDA